jgi:hypothetical protein
MIPYNPQTVEELSKRFLQAIEKLYNQLNIAEGIEPRPGKFPEHVFDFGDGIRLIISREEIATGDQVLHISGSANKDGGRLTLDEYLLQHIVEHFALISGIKDALILIGITPAQVAHFYLEDKMVLPAGSKVH